MATYTKHNPPTKLATGDIIVFNYKGKDLLACVAAEAFLSEAADCGWRGSTIYDHMGIEGQEERDAFCEALSGMRVHGYSPDCDDFDGLIKIIDGLFRVADGEDYRQVMKKEGVLTKEQKDKAYRVNKKIQEADFGHRRKHVEALMEVVLGFPLS